MNKLISSLILLTSIYTLLAQDSVQRLTTDRQNCMVSAGIISGIWIPTGKLYELGIHPLTGLKMDVIYYKIYYGLDVDFRFLLAGNGYNFYYEYEDSTLLTDYFFSGKYGLHFGREIIAGKNYSLKVNLGIAYDFIKAVNKRDQINYSYPVPVVAENDKLKYMSSYQISFGLVNRFELYNNTYIDLGASYQVVDYTLQKRSDLYGNSVIITMAFGLSNIR